MHIKLKKLKDIISKNCVTIILNTHRTRPDNEQDPKKLKNLVKGAKERLLSNNNKSDVTSIIQRLEELESEIDYRHNLESLILFVNDDIKEYISLPISVKDRVIIDNTFATRDLVRALHRENNYFILVLSQQKVRLIEAFNDRVVEEAGNPFPIDNTQFYSTNKEELSNASKQTNLIAEFFNRVDKEVNKVRRENPLPVLICTEESNYHQYLKIADQKNTIFDAYLNRNRLDDTAQSIVSDAWNIIKAEMAEKNKAQKEELKKAVGKGKFLSDLNDIYRAILEGRVQTLFIEEGLYKSAILNGHEIQLVSSTDVNNKEVVDDIYDEMIEENMNYGGSVVFLPNGELENFQGFAAVTRY